MSQTKQTQDNELPANIMLDKWADIGFHWQGELAVAGFSRLAKQVLNAADTLAVTAHLAKDDGILWLNYSVAGSVTVACQRCLSPLIIDVSGDYGMALLYSEDDIARIDDAEFVLISEVLGSENRRMLPIKDLLEDELLLTLPLSPRHDDCDMYVESVGDEIADATEEKENPFAALASLKGKLS